MCHKRNTNLHKSKVFYNEYEKHFTVMLGKYFN